jgi:hypothetical protein
MTKKYFFKTILVFSLLILVFASCKKDNKNTKIVTPDATPVNIGLYAQDTLLQKGLFVPVSKLGNQDLTNVDNAIFFDTGSGGLVMDAQGILPASIITDNGFTMVVNGITITKEMSTIEYGDNDTTADKVYGYLAYAPLVFGENDNVTIQRLPFFLYYKAVDAKGNKYDPHEFDIFGVSPEYDVDFPSGDYITSPLSYFDPGQGLTKGFKIAAVGNNFTNLGYLVPKLITLGLTSDDLSSSSGYYMNALTYHAGDGYAPLVKANVTYAGTTFSVDAVFDSGTEPYSFILDPKYSGTSDLLAPNVPISVSTNGGFSYNFVTSATDNLTYIENPVKTGDAVTIFSLEFFINNSYLLNYASHEIGLKND